ncbi:MAG: NAD kinase [Rhizobiales bacterium]|nr:NAD kinase [Hyphomicrobiales bacterium]
MKFKNLCFISSGTDEANAALKILVNKHGNCDQVHADVIIALGGDGFMLQCLHDFHDKGISIYGLNRGTVGFLMNEYSQDDLINRLNNANKHVVNPLKAEVTTVDGEKHIVKAFNEVSLLRQTHQAAKLQISINQKTRLDELVCDGVIISTPVGSTAYNLSAHGPIIPINTPLIALTPISPFRPRNWRGALLRDSVTVSIKICSPQKRPVSAVADHLEIRNIEHITITKNKKSTASMLFDDKHSLEERILREQFGY